MCYRSIQTKNEIKFITHYYSQIKSTLFPLNISKLYKLFKLFYINGCLNRNFFYFCKIKYFLNKNNLFDFVNIKHFI